MTASSEANLSTQLEETFTLWFHSSSDQDWSIDSYHEIFNFNTVDEFLTLLMAINTRPKMLLNGMFFIMRQGIKPTWEDPINKDGGVFTWKVEKEDVLSAWENMCMLLVTGSLHEIFDEYGFNGISISPKKTNNILKVWLSVNPSETVINELRMTPECNFNNAPRIYKTHQSANSD
jgi:translation initiation factor 4E